MLPDVSIRQLEYLVAVTEHPTWSDAAAAVGVSASALSQGLGELQRRIGVALFEPDGRRRRFRPEARPVLAHARQVLALTGDLVAWSERVAGGATGRVRVGMIDVAAVVHFAGVLASFRREHSDVDLTLTVAPSGALLADLVGGALDVVVCVRHEDGPAASEGVELVDLFDEPMIVLAPPGVEVGRPGDVGPAGAWGPWVTFPAGSHSRLGIERRLGELGVSVEVVAESHQPDVLREMVRLGLGWTVLPPSQAGDGSLTAGPELFRRTLVLATRTGAIVDPATQRLTMRLRGGE